jgi:hypothetical protein
MAARIFHDLVDHELRVPPHVEAFDAYLDGDLEAAKQVLTVYFGAPSMFIILWFGFDYGTNPPLGTLII